MIEQDVFLLFLCGIVFMLYLVILRWCGLIHFCELCVVAWLLVVWVFLIHKLKMKLYLYILKGLQGKYRYSCTHS